MDSANEIYNNFSLEASKISSLKECNMLYVHYLGKSGILSNKLRALGSMSKEERASKGIELNRFKQLMEAKLRELQEKFTHLEHDNTMPEDYRLPIRNENIGSEHPLSHVAKDVYCILHSMGFEFTAGPEIEDEYHNFTALNTPEHHPARQMQDSFYFDARTTGGRLMLRTQTSSVQIRTMNSTPPPHKIFSIGRVYRRDWDATHTPMFTQVEGLLIDKNVSFADMKWYVSTFLHKFFDSSDLQFRFRPSFFPFVEPGAEVDVLYPKKQSSADAQCKTHDWMEIMGCGMVHANVLKIANLDQDYVGFAFGMGLERLAMLKYGIDDLRNFFNPDVRWLGAVGFLPFD